MGVPTMDQQWLNTYREEIGGFSNTIHSFAQGEIARKDYKGISGGFGSYAQRDAAKHMLRLRLPGGRAAGRSAQLRQRGQTRPGGAAERTMERHLSGGLGRHAPRKRIHTVGICRSL